MAVYASKGEVVTCVNGHPIYKISGNIFIVRSPISIQVERTKGQLTADECAPRCKCGAPYARWIGTNIELHFSDGWRSREHGKVETSRSSNPAQRVIRDGGMDTKTLRY